MEGSELRSDVAFSPVLDRLEIGSALYRVSNQTSTDYETPFARKSNFIALYFESAADRQPGVFSDPVSMRAGIDLRDTGIVLAASDDSQVCFAEHVCASGQFLVAYGVRTQETAWASSAAGGESLVLQSDVLQSLSERQ